MKRPSVSALLEQTRAVLEEAGVAFADDPALPGFIIPWEEGEERLGIYALVPFDGAILVRATVPVELKPGQFVAALALCNEVNRRVPFGTTQVCPDRGQVQVRLGRMVYGRLMAEEVLSQIGMVRDLAFTLFGPWRLLAGGDSEVARVVEAWEEALADKAACDDEEPLVDPAG